MGGRGLLIYQREIVGLFFDSPLRRTALRFVRQWRILLVMRFIETLVFTRAIVAFLNDEAYRSLQLAMLRRPESGPLIPNGGGLRKLRWPLAGRGKRGGLRVIYFWDGSSETFYMLYAYPKNEQEDLTARQLRVLARLVREEFG